MNYLKNISTFSVKNFISDLPGMLNVAFESIKRTILGFYNPDTNTINTDNIEVTGNIRSNSVTTNFFTVKNVNGKNITIANIDSSISSLQEQMNNYKSSVSELIDPISIDTVRTYINNICV